MWGRKAPVAVRPRADELPDRHQHNFQRLNGGPEQADRPGLGQAGGNQLCKPFLGAVGLFASKIHFYGCMPATETCWCSCLLLGPFDRGCAWDRLGETARCGVLKEATDIFSHASLCEGSVDARQPQGLTSEPGENSSAQSQRQPALNVGGGMARIPLRRTDLCGKCAEISLAALAPLTLVRLGDCQEPSCYLLSILLSLDFQPEECQARERLNRLTCLHGLCSERLRQPKGASETLSLSTDELPRRVKSRIRAKRSTSMLFRSTAYL